MSEESEKYDIEITPGTDEVEEYDPVPVSLFDNGIIIFDPIEFVATYNCHAALYSEGTLYVLDRETSRWRSVEPVPVKPVSVR
jgi:hypothetical protein